MGVQFCTHAVCLQVPHPSCVTWMPCTLCTCLPRLRCVAWWHRTLNFGGCGHYLHLPGVTVRSDLQSAAPSVMNMTTDPPSGRAMHCSRQKKKKRKEGKAQRYPPRRCSWQISGCCNVIAVQTRRRSGGCSTPCCSQTCVKPAALARHVSVRAVCSHKPTNERN